MSTDSFASFSSSINDRHLPHGISIDVTNHDSDEDEIDDREREEDHEPLDNGELKSTNNKVTVSSRLRRKPPPGEDFQMQLNDKSRDTISSGSYSLNPDEVYSLQTPICTRIWYLRWKLRNNQAFPTISRRKSLSSTQFKVSKNIRK